MSDMKEGFYCPLCMENLRSKAKLERHFIESHPEANKTSKNGFQSILDKLMGGGKETNLIEVSEPEVNLSFEIYDVKLEIGRSRNHTADLKSMRKERLDNLTIVTTNLIIRLDKLLLNENTDSAKKRLHEQNVVPWVDEKLIDRCPDCAKMFNLTRRKHHCRLCGLIMCGDCSIFMPREKSESILSRKTSPELRSTDDEQENNLRICIDCNKKLDIYWQQITTKKETYHPIMELYEKLGPIYKSMNDNLKMYMKMLKTINDGKITYRLEDARNLWDSIVKNSEKLRIIGKKIIEFQPEKPKTNKELRLQRAIGSSINMYIQSEIMSLEQLPSDELYEELRKKREQKTHEEIWRQKNEMLANESMRVKTEFVHRQTTPTKANRSNHVVMDAGWVPEAKVIQMPNEDPIVVQINTIKGYIKQAKDAFKFDDVLSLESQLKAFEELYAKQRQDEYKNRLNKEDNYNERGDRLLETQEEYFSKSATPSHSTNPFDDDFM